MKLWEGGNEKNEGLVRKCVCVFCGVFSVCVRERLREKEGEMEGDGRRVFIEFEWW